MDGAISTGWRSGVLAVLLLSALEAGAAGGPGGERSLVERSPEGTVTTRVPGDAQVIFGIGGSGQSRPLARSVVGSGPERVLIRLQGEPLARARARGLAVTALGLATQRQRAATAILSIVSAVQGRTVARGDVITREYSQVFHGFAATLSRAEQAQVRQLPDVAAVVPDTEVRAVLADSVPLVRAPVVWSSTGYRGAGRTIAVVDTGIDYGHADLGGCFGGGCKVAGGYDFANGDTDPRDDHGHGTHVAATAAGSGTFLGVAPDARLLAYKVLNAGGFGYTSNVIAGIERAVDPNDDGNTADHADVINLSLGGSGDPDDPGSQAVDNASAAGVVVAAAAGNSGGFSTIGSPGTARTAITVGASDKHDDMANFSSGGPSPVIFGLKPEIVAPGVDICAAQALGTALGPSCTDGTHIRISGTSMATPHVAGAAALLRGLFPARPVAEIKALLVENAVDLGFPVLQQGAGRLDVAAAAAAKTAITPAAVSFGLADLTVATWTPSQTLSVHNLDTASRSYALTAGGLPAGVTATFTPASFTLGAGLTQTVTFDLAVDNTSVPNPPSAPFAYDGVVAVASGTQQQRVPFVFVKSPVLRLHFDESPILIVVHDRLGLFGVASSGGSTTADFLIPAGTYDAMVYFYNVFTGVTSLVVREGIVVNDFTEATIERTEAVHHVAFTVRDESNAVLGTSNAMRFFRHRVSGAGFASSSSWNDFESGPLSDAYHVDFAGEAIAGANRYFVADAIRDGITADRQTGNVAGDLTAAELRYYEQPDDVDAGLVYWIQVQMSSFFGFGTSTGIPSPLLTQPLFVNHAPPPPFTAFYEPWVSTVSGYTHRGTLIHGAPAPNTIDAFHFFAPDTPVYETTSGELPVNLGPPLWFERFTNFQSFVGFAAPIGNWCWSFLGQGGDGPEGPGGTVPWRLRQGPTEVAAGTLPQSGFGCSFRPFVGVAPGIYAFEAGDLPYYVGGYPGTTRVEATFNTEAGDANPPWFEGLSLRAAGKLVDAVQPGTPVELGLTVRDEDVAAVTVTYDEGQGAIAVPVTALGSDRYAATIPACQGLQAVSLVVMATDSTGNTLRQEFAPAYACGTPTCPVGCGPCERCEAIGCVAHPRNGCRAPSLPAEAALTLRQSSTGANRLVWDLKKQATAATDFGNPAADEDYALCLFDESGSVPVLTSSAEIPAGELCNGRPCWHVRGILPPGSKGYRYRNDRSTPDGISDVLLKPGGSAIARITVKGKGGLLAPPPLPLALPSRVQLQTKTGVCWEARYTVSDALKNDFRRFRGKTH